jgi:hypothetical protein
VTVSDPRHSVYIYNCSGSVVQVRRQALCERTQVIHRALYANHEACFVSSGLAGTPPASVASPTGQFSVGLATYAGGAPSQP